MMKKSIKKNYILNLFNQILILITPLIVTPYLSRVLGPDGIGINSYIGSISSYFVLFATLGLTHFGQREISYVQNDFKKRSIIFWETNLIEGTTSLICIVFYVVFALLQSNRSIYLIYVFYLLVVVADISWFFQGMEEFGKVVLKNIFFKILHTVFVFTMVKTKNDLTLYILGSAVITFVNAVSYWIGIKKYVEKPSWKELHPSRHLKTVLSLFMPTIAIQIYTVLDKTMIGLITKDAFENGYYEQAMKISKIVLSIVTSLSVVIRPRIASSYQKKDFDKVLFYVYESFRFVWFLGVPLFLGLTLTAGNFIPWFLGPDYEKVISLVAILSFLIIAIGISDVTGWQYLVQTGRQNVFTRTVVYGAIINFVLNLVLISQYQSMGAAVSSVIAESFISVSQLFILRKELNIRKIIFAGGNYFLAGAGMSTVLLLLNRYLTPSIVNTIILVLCGAFSYFLILLLRHDIFLFELIDSLKNKLK